MEIERSNSWGTGYLIYEKETKNIIARAKKHNMANVSTVSKALHNIKWAILGLGIFYGIYCAATSKDRGGFLLTPATKVIKKMEAVGKTISSYKPGK